MRLNLIALEKKKNRLEDKIVGDFRDSLAWLISCELIQVLVLFFGIISFLRQHYVAGVVMFIFYAIDLILFKHLYDNAITLFRDEVLRFWSNLKMMAEVEDFDFVGEEDQHIPRVD